ncbi:MAG TPA: hypothetical protein PK358_13890 [Spirochaetota bacterium]|nr:hypothetical protein [Spirochaetota bacterium]HPJ35925.1 hypothetical protein [Spirochaetota bacterium]
MKNKVNDITNEGGRVIITVPVITKSFISKSGRVTDIREYYIRRSIQDYFIKFCESGITSGELEEYLSTIEGAVRTATMEVEFRNGEWDRCEGDPEQQSRIGEYAVIHKIIKK